MGAAPPALGGFLFLSIDSIRLSEHERVLGEGAVYERCFEVRSQQLAPSTFRSLDPVTSNGQISRLLSLGSLLEQYCIKLPCELPCERWEL